MRIPVVWAAFALSLLLHALLLWPGWLPKLTPLSLEDALKGRTQGALAVRIAPPARPPAPPAAPEARPSPAQKAPGAPSARPAREAPRVLTREARRPGRAVAPPAPAASAPAAPAQGDLAAYIEARRRAREPAIVAAPPAPPAAPAPPAQPAETEQERDNRIAAARLGLDQAPSFDGGERKTGGGIFQVARVGYEDAEFFFYGWNKNIRRRARQMIEVRKGDAPTMELAVVRRMIAIIREHTSGNFVWESQRLGREVTLSAAPADNAGLEDFMMREFFYVEARPR